MTSGRSGDRSGDNNAVVHNSHRGGGGGGGGGGSMMITSPSVPITMPHCSTNTSPMSAALISVGRWGVQRLEREREVFLRLIIEFWLCQVSKRLPQICDIDGDETTSILSSLSS